MVRLSRVRGSGRCGEQLVMGGHDNHAAGSLSTLHQQFLLPGAAHILVSSSALATVAVQQRCLVHHCWFISETVSEIMSQISHRTNIVCITLSNTLPLLYERGSWLWRCEGGTSAVSTEA